MANSFNTLAEIAFDQKSFSRAGELLQRALQIQETIWGSHHPHIARTVYNLALLALALDEQIQAEKYLVCSLTIRQQALRPHHPDLIAVQQRYTDLQRRSGRLDTSSCTS